MRKDWASIEKLFRRVALCVIGVAILLTGLPATSTASPPTATPVEEYQDYLRQQVGGAKILAQFDALTSGQQRKFVEYVTDDLYTQKVAQALSADAGRVNLYGGDVVITVKSGVDEKTDVRTASTTLASTRTAWVRKDVKIRGISVMIAKTWVTYTARGGVARRVHAAGNDHRNWYPLNSLSAKTHRPWISGGRARTATKWTVTSCFPQPVVCVSQSGTQRIAAKPGSVIQSWN
jgi:hypothetical protein